MDDQKEADRNVVEPVARNDFFFNMNASQRNTTTKNNSMVASTTTSATTNTNTTALATNYTKTTREKPHHFVPTNRMIIAIIVYFALLLDNVLLTVIVPILPHYLASLDNRTYQLPLDVDNGAAGLGFGVSAHNLAYRSMESSARSLPSILTKHPIPGKSMVNLSLTPVLFDGDKMSASVLNVGAVHNNNNNNTLQQLQQPRRVGIASDIEKKKPEKNTTTIQNINGSDENLAKENGSIGFLLAMKALVQLICNPIVGNLSARFGYRLPIVFGTFCLFLSSLGFAIGETYSTLLLARSVQGVGSACIGVCGMSLVAQHYPEEERRSKVMGIILGSIALGVLLGYPVGGILYDLVGKSTPFIILSTVIFLNLGMQLFTMDLSFRTDRVVSAVDGVSPTVPARWKPLVESKMILAIVVAIWLSTSTMAILEPCLPIWLMQHLNPYKWQLGTVFIPDSIGYFIGTNFFGTVAYKNGQVKIACVSMLLVGISSILIPNAATVWQLLVPHFVLGLGIGIIDASLVPLLATFVDASLNSEADEVFENGNEVGSMSSYGTVYAIQQTSVSLAYFLAPLLGGELAEVIGFAWLMRIIGFINLVYGPILIVLNNKYDPKVLNERRNQMLLSNSGVGGNHYKKLYNSVNVE